MVEAPTLSEILAQMASEVGEEVSVDVDTFMETVSISAPGQEDIFLQGDEAAQFIEACEANYEEAQNLPMDVIERAQAKAYVENIWG